MAEPQSIYLERGDAAQSAYDQLGKISQANGGKLSAFQIKLLATLTGRSSNYKVGEYEFDSKATLSELLTRLSKGQITQRRIRKGDPFGLVRHEKELADRITVFIHPRTVRLDTLNAGVPNRLASTGMSCARPFVVGFSNNKAGPPARSTRSPISVISRWVSTGVAIRFNSPVFSSCDMKSRRS